MASEAILAKKKEEVTNLAEKIKEAKLVLLTDYRGITVDDVTKLRNTVRDTKSEYKVSQLRISLFTFIFVFLFSPFLLHMFSLYILKKKKGLS